MWATLNNGRNRQDGAERRSTRQHSEKRSPSRSDGPPLGPRARDIMLAGVLLVSVAAVLKCGEVLAAGGMPAGLHSEVVSGLRAVLSANAEPPAGPSA